MSVGLIALLDDIAALAKVAAASLDDVVSQAAKAGSKAAGIVIDDAAVTPRYVTGFAAARELPIIGRIALGSLKNKLLVLLPAALLLSALLPQAITPLLMIGGVYLCYEGVEKLYELLFPHAAHAHEATVESIALAATSVEDEKVASAIKTDFILSAEIMAVTLATVPESGIVMQAAVLAVVGVLITVGVYGAVALIVKADDVGVVLARQGPPVGALGRALVIGMPHFLEALGLVGMAAMIWVGGGIIVHGLEHYGIDGPAHLIHAAGAIAARAVPPLGGVVGWLAGAAGAGVVGILVGLLAIPAISYALSPLWGWIKMRRGKPR